MASFDFIDASSKGYEFVWRERKYLSRVAIPVLFVKVACLLAVFALGAGEMYMRQGLISLPSFVVEALFVVGLIRYILYKEPIWVWGKAVPVPDSDSKPASYQGYMSRKQCIQGGIATYLLLKIIFGGLSALVLDNYDYFSAADDAQGEAEIATLHPLIDTFIMFGVIASFVWGFRLLWLYIPIAMGFSFADYFKKMSGLRSSICMIATWFICFLPLVILFVSVIQLFTGLLLEGSAAFVIVRSSLEGAAEIILICVSVVAMTHGIAQILSGKSDK